jgi:hypothetical protein
MMQVSRPAAEVVDVPGEARPAGLDRGVQDGSDRGVQAACIGQAQAAGPPRGMDSRVMQGLIGVDVADVGDDSLVEQHGPDRGTGVPGQAVPEGRHRERLAHRLRPEPAQERVARAGVRACQADPAQSPRIVVIMLVPLPLAALARRLREPRFATPSALAQPGGPAADT